jgi:hypothetical protein
MRTRVQRIFLTAAIILPLNAMAVPNCPGSVTEILEWPSKCGGNLAYKLDSVPGKWLCTTSSKGESLVLTAYVTGKTLTARLAADLPCNEVESYHTPLYIVLR